MYFDVFGQVVAAGKLLLAHGALVGLDPRVRAAVARELVRPGEPATRKEGSRGQSERREVSC